MNWTIEKFKHQCDPCGENCLIKPDAKYSIMDNTAVIADVWEFDAAKLIVAAPKLLAACKSVPDPADRFNLGQLNTWNKNPEKLTIVEISKLICYLNDSWFAHQKAAAAVEAAEGEVNPCQK